MPENKEHSSSYIREITKHLLRHLKVIKNNMKYLLKIWSLIKTHKKKSIFLFFVLIIGGWYFLGGGKTETLKINTAEAGSVIQEVSISGRVVSSQAVDLSFEQSGKVSYIALKNGQSVRTGGLIAQLNSQDALKNIRDAEFALENAKITLARLKITQNTDIPRLNDAITTAQNNLDQAYQNGFNEVANTFLDLSSILTGAKEILTGNTIESDNSNSNVYNNKVRIENRGKITLLLDRSFAEYKSADEAYDKNIISYNFATRTSSSIIIEALIDETLETAKKLAQAVKDEQNVLDTVVDEIKDIYSTAIVPSKITAYQSDVAVYIGKLNGHITSLTNTSNSITTNKQNLTNAQRTLDSSQLSNPLDISSQENIVKQRESAVLDARINLAKYSVRAPFNGIVANIDIKVGQLVTPQIPIVSLIGDAKFQIETNVSEADIAKIKVGNETVVTLDAYGKDQKLKAKVVHIDPAGRIVNNVVTYKVILEFVENDQRLLSGLTADVSIQTNKKENVVYVQSRDVITKNDKKFVKVLLSKEEVKNLANLTVVSSIDEGEIVEVPVEVGLRGSDGRTEVITGVKIGDKIIGK